MNKGHDIYGRPAGFNQHQLNLEKQAQIKEIEQSFPNFNVRVALNQVLQSTKTDVINLNLIISNELMIPLEIFVDEMFPYTCPKIIVKKQIRHEKINPNTFELNYTADYVWNYQIKTTLKILITTLIHMFKKNPPKADPNMEVFNKLRDRVFQEMNNFQSFDCYKLYPNKDKCEYESMVMYSKEKLVQELIKSEKYKNLLTALLDLFEFNQKNLIQIHDKTHNIENKRKYLENLAVEFEAKKEILINKFNNANMIKERFNKTKILNVLEEEINRFEEEQPLGLVISSSPKKHSIVEKKFEQTCQDYLENRMKYHNHVIKKQRWENTL